MPRVNVRLIGRPFRRVAAGEEVELSRQDARALIALGRAEAVEAKKAAPKKADAPERGDALETPEAKLETVAHSSKDAPASKSARKRAPRKSRTKAK